MQASLRGNDMVECHLKVLSSWCCNFQWVSGVLSPHIELRSLCRWVDASHLLIQWIEHQSWSKNMLFGVGNHSNTKTFCNGIRSGCCGKRVNWDQLVSQFAIPWESLTGWIGRVGKSQVWRSCLEILGSPSGFNMNEYGVVLSFVF